MQLLPRGVCKIEIGGDRRAMGCHCMWSKRSRRCTRCQRAARACQKYRQHQTYCDTALSTPQHQRAQALVRSREPIKQGGNIRGGGGNQTQNTSKVAQESMVRHLQVNHHQGSFSISSQQSGVQIASSRRVRLPFLRAEKPVVIGAMALGVCSLPLMRGCFCTCGGFITHQ